MSICSHSQIASKIETDSFAGEFFCKYFFVCKYARIQKEGRNITSRTPTDRRLLFPTIAGWFLAGLWDVTTSLRKPPPVDQGPRRPLGGWVTYSQVPRPFVNKVSWRTLPRCFPTFITFIMPTSITESNPWVLLSHYIYYRKT